MPERSDPGPALEAAFRRIAAGPMTGLPFLNPRLSVEAVGFRPWAEGWLGVVVTPWFLNLIWVPHEPPQGRTGQVRTLQLEDAEPYDFILGFEGEVGGYYACSLLSPVLEIEDQATARIMAQTVMAQLRPPQGRQWSRRELLRGLAR